MNLNPFVQSTQTITVNKNPQFTRNLFGPIDEISGKTLKLIERNPEGDCLCVFHGKMGWNLIDVNHRNIL